MNIKSIFRSIYFKIISANRVAEYLGVEFGKNCIFNSKKFGGEPYMIKIGNNFYSSLEVQFLNHDGSVNVIRNLYPQYKNIDYFSPIIIGNNVFLGYGVTVLPGTIIDNNVIVGAGSLVRGVLKENSVYAGVPAKYICSIDEYIEKNSNQFIQTKNLEKNDKYKFINKWLKNNFSKFDI
jgi:acetyltransferase-like isoleucine patch superfamily enzyme